MPIALFPELAKGLTDAAKRLANWALLAPLEEQLLRRARGAFLVKWFGPLVPEHQLNLHIAIANIAALRARLEQANESMSGPEAEMNLLRPLAAMAGTLLGGAMSLSGSVLIVPYFHDLFEVILTAWYWAIPKLLYTTLINWLMPALGPAIMLFVGVPLLSALAFANALGGNRELRAIYGLGGDLAMMLDAFFRFWDQITGPVDQIRNPVVRALVKLINRVAHLFAQILGLVSLIVVKVLPLVPSLLAQWRAMHALGTEVLGIAADALSGLRDALTDPFGKGSIKTIIIGMFSLLVALPGRIIEEITFLVTASATELGYAYEALTKLLKGFIDGLTDRIIAAFKETPLGLLIDRIKVMLALKPEIMKAITGGPVAAAVTGGGGGGGKGLAGVEETLRSFKVAFGLGLLERVAEALPGERAGRRVGVDLGFSLANVIGAARRINLPTRPALNLPDFPDLPSLPDTAALHSRIGAPAPRDLGQDATDALVKAQEEEKKRKLPAALRRRPGSAFAGQLADSPLPSAPGANQLALRDAIYVAVGRVLPAALRLYAPTLREAFDKIDSDVYGIDSTAGPLPDHPQLELPDSGLLRPVIDSLTFRSLGGYAPDIRAFRDMVTTALQANTYRAPDAAVAG